MIEHSISESVIDGAVDVIINTRDFCGDEREAVRDYCADLKQPHWQTVYRIANFRANARWNEFQKSAGVDPKYTY
jgi:hypothetical protein